jgi:hypothetical protein
MPRPPYAQASGVNPAGLAALLVLAGEGVHPRLGLLVADSASPIAEKSTKSSPFKFA